MITNLDITVVSDYGSDEMAEDIATAVIQADYGVSTVRIKNSRTHAIVGVWHDGNYEPGDLVTPYWRRHA